MADLYENLTRDEDQSNGLKLAFPPQLGAFALAANPIVRAFRDETPGAHEAAA